MEVVPDESVESTEAVPGVHLTQGAAGDEASAQRFHIEPGAEVPEHDHPHEQVGVIARGTLTFVVDGAERAVSAGDTFAIPGGESHAAYNDGEVPVEGVDVFSPPRTDPDWEE